MRSAGRKPAMRSAGRKPAMRSSGPNRFRTSSAGMASIAASIRCWPNCITFSGVHPSTSGSGTSSFIKIPFNPEINRSKANDLLINPLRSMVAKAFWYSLLRLAKHLRKALCGSSARLFNKMTRKEPAHADPLAYTPFLSVSLNSSRSMTSVVGVLALIRKLCNSCRLSLCPFR